MTNKSLRPEIVNLTSQSHGHFSDFKIETNPWTNLRLRKLLHEVASHSSRFTAGCRCPVSAPLVVDAPVVDARVQRWGSVARCGALRAGGARPRCQHAACQVAALSTGRCASSPAGRLGPSSPVPSRRCQHPAPRPAPRARHIAHAAGCSSPNTAPAHRAICGRCRPPPRTVGAHRTEQLRWPGPCPPRPLSRGRMLT